jgi:hypothetical protein
MTYKYLLQKLAKFGITQVARSMCDGYDIVYLARPTQAVFPYAFPQRSIILDAGPDSEIDEEIVDAILRWAEKTRGELDPIQ